VATTSVTGSRRVTIPIGFCIALLGCRTPSGTLLVPSSVTRSLSVEVDDALILGDTSRGIALLREGAATREVSANWGSSAPTIVSVEQGGWITAQLVGMVTIHAAYEELQAARELSVVASFDGSWSGRVALDTCRRESGPGPDPCRFGLGAQAPIQMDLRQQTRRLSGELSIFAEPITGILNATVERRTARIDEPLSLSGGGQRITVTSLRMTLDESSRLAIDEFLVRHELTNAFGRQTILGRFRAVVPLVPLGAPGAQKRKR